MTVFQMPFYFIQEESLEEKAIEWFTSHVAPKRLTPSFEPVPGWKPFKDYKSGAEIIARAIRDNKRYMINVGDYFEEIVNDTTYHWTIAEFNHYGCNEALLVPDRLRWNGTQFSDSNNTYSGSILESKFNNFYHMMPSSLKPYVLNMRLPWTDSNGSTSYIREHVFPPSEIEAFGFTTRSSEPSGSYKRWDCFTGNSSRVRDGKTYWLRSTYSGYSAYIPAVDIDGSAASRYYANLGGILPCFCIGGGGR